MQGTLVIMHGDSSDLHEREVLGQLDLTGIPPAPAQTPRIRVTLALDTNHALRASVVDLDTERQKAWELHGAVVWTAATGTRRSDIC